jgi:3-oxoacyl-[acyl-carrier-protein] synthase II
LSRTRERRVVITGLGCISPVGNNVADTWSAIKEGKSGIATVTKFDATPFTTHFAGEVKGFNIEDYIPAKEASYGYLHPLRHGRRHPGHPGQWIDGDR